MSTVENSLSLPQFTQIKLETIPDELKSLLSHHLLMIESILQDKKEFTWNNTVAFIEALEDELHRFWSPIQHMNAVINSPKLRELMKVCLPMLSDYHTQLGQNEKLYQAILAIQNSETFHTLTAAQKKTIEYNLRNFKLNGVHLPLFQKKQFTEISKSLAELSRQFENNVLDATMAWKKHITDKQLLSGIPDRACHAAKLEAKKYQVDGWMFTLEAPSYLAVMMNADSTVLRQTMYEAYVTRASEMGPCANKWDNTLIMHTIVKKRFELAKLLGFNNYAEYSLATKMVKKIDEVFRFLNHLAERVVPKARKEFQQLSEFAKKDLGIDELQAWDIAYASEKMRQKEYDLSQEDLRPYFSEPDVMNGLFTIIEKLYYVRMKKAEGVDVWHKDAVCFNVFDSQNHLQARIFFDLYARENKRDGAWMDECCVRRQLENGDIQIPVAHVICNFNGPVDDEPTLFTHDDVVTLFHECGHALQHILTKVNIASVSGLNGIPWDAVEMASQLFENWAFERESIDLFAKHYKTREKLPDVLYQRMQRAKNFQSALHMARQLEFAIFDFQLHIEFDENDPKYVINLLNDVRKKTSAVPVPAFNRFQNSFQHIFSGNYAAGYYSYKWAEVMACDAFSLFLEKGIFDQSTSEKFKKTFLESGGSREPLELFIEFRGRKPTVDALLQQHGIL